MGVLSSNPSLFRLVFPNAGMQETRALLSAECPQNIVKCYDARILVRVLPFMETHLDRLRQDLAHSVSFSREMIEI